MLSKCANPKCHAVFRYLHEGKLFESHVRPFDDPAVNISVERPGEIPSRKIEFFWLCAECASKMTLILQPHTREVIPVPLHNHVEGERAICVSIEEQSHHD